VRDREWPEVEGILVKRRATGDKQPMQKIPTLRARDPWRMDDVRGHRVAWKRRLVDEQHAIALAREQHRGRSIRRSALPTTNRVT